MAPEEHTRFCADCGVELLEEYDGPSPTCRECQDVDNLATLEKKRATP